MDREKKPGLQAQAAQARARAAELDRQVRVIERSAGESWRHRARSRDAAARLRVMAGDCLVEAQKLEESLGSDAAQDFFE